MDRRPAPCSEENTVETVEEPAGGRGIEAVEGLFATLFGVHTVIVMLVGIVATAITLAVMLV